METYNFEEQFKKFANDWRARLEDLQVQFSLGKMDAAEAFEKQKDTFRDLVVKLKNDIDASGEEAKKSLTEFMSKLQDLLVQLNLGKAEGKDLFEEQKKKIDAAMQEVVRAGKDLYHTQFEQMMKLFDNNSSVFKTGLEIVKLQYTLGKMDAKDEAEKLRKEMNEKINEMNAGLKQAQELGKESMETWMKQMKDGYEKMKKVSEDWVKK